MSDYEKRSGQIDPFVLSQYLIKKKWQRYSTRRTDITVFQYIEDGKFEQVIIPNVRTLSDYPLAVYQAVTTIASVEGRSIGQVLETLLNPYADIVKIGIHEAGAEPGTISFDGGAKLYENARRLVEASARDVLRSTDCHAGSPDELVQSFLSRCRFGKTGSEGYMLPLVCPFIIPDSEPATIFERPGEYAESLTRKVTRHLMEGVFAIKTAIDTGARPDIPLGSDFCEALAGICDQPSGSQVSFHVQWSFAVSENITLYERFELSSSHAASIEAMSKNSD